MQHTQKEVINTLTSNRPNYKIFFQPIYNKNSNNMNLSVDNFIKSLFETKLNIQIALNKCSQNDLGYIRSIFLENLKYADNEQQAKSYKLVIDLIEANNFIRFVKE